MHDSINSYSTRFANVTSRYAVDCNAGGRTASVQMHLLPDLSDSAMLISNTPKVSLRPPSEVMRLERLGCYHPSRLSFTRTLIRRLHREQWKFSISQDTLDEQGFGDFVYLIQTPKGPLSFVAFSQPLDARDRTDRVIATQWDMSFTLVNGNVEQSDIERLRKEVPKQESGRMSEREIVLSRANKSVRLFREIANKLAAGEQPDTQRIASIGYLVRTTAVYGNGKFGLMDFDQVKRTTPFSLPFQAEMLTVYLARQFSFEVLERIAKGFGKERYVPLNNSTKRVLGVGNATGLGMAPFLVGHPQLIHQWIYIRELAIAQVKSVQRISTQKHQQFTILLEKVRAHVRQWRTQDERQSRRISTLKNELEQLSRHNPISFNSEYPWKSFCDWTAATKSTECVELVNSMLLEIYPELVNELEQYMGIDEEIFFDPSMTVRELKDQLETKYDWALEIDFSEPDSQFLFWYFSVEKEEPRLGHRYYEPGRDLEMRIGVARDVSRLYQDLCSLTRNGEKLTTAEFLLQSPQHRYIVTRVQSLARFEYAEIHNNLLDVNCLPIDLLRCKLALFGASRFDPKSNLWTRITLFQGAPLIDQLRELDVDDWAFPSVPNS